MLPNPLSGGAGVAGSASEIDDQALMARVARADRLAFERLYRRYFSRLSRFLGRMTHRSHIVDEVLNDTMLVVWNRAASYRDDCKVSTWVFGIAYRTALKALGRVRDAGCAESAEEEAADEGDGPEQKMMRTQDRAILDEALSRLSAEHRAVVELTYFQGFACREIALIVGCPTDTVKTRLFHARRRLRTILSTRKEDLR